MSCIHRLAALALAALALAGAARGASAGTVVLEPTKDNTLVEDADGALSNGAGPYLFVGSTGADGGELVQRGVLEFDVAGNVPADATITDAALTLNLAGAPPIFTAATVTLHRALAEWGEGTSFSTVGGGDASTPGDATWVHTFYDTGFWSGAGGDYVGTESAGRSVLALGLYTWSSAALVDDVQLFLESPGSNHGWVVIGDESPGRARRFDSREGSDPSLRPRLTVVYDEVAEAVGACCIPDAAATCNEVTATPCADAGGDHRGDLTTCAATTCPVIPTPFADALPIPPVATPVSGTAGGAASYAIAMREVQQTLHSELPTTTIWGYDDGVAGARYPGPTLEAASGAPVSVDWQNDLRDTSAPGSPKPLRTDHLLPVDLCPHGAEDAAKTVVHLHGTHTEARYDGHPEDTILPGQQDTYVYPNPQPPGTLWYHDHALGTTRLNVYLGLSGFYLIRDAVEDALDLPAGEFEVPLLVADRSFAPDGSLVYPAGVQEAFFGDTILVNGRVWPHHPVKRGKYRLRLLNGSNSRHLTLSFCPGEATSPCPSPAGFWLIGGDLGLLPAPVALTEITLGPAERADLVFDFEPYVAPSPAEVYLVNSAPAPFPGPPGQGVVAEVMRFDVADVPGHSGPVPATLRSFPVLDESEAVVERAFELVRGPGDACSAFRWQIVSLEDGHAVGSAWMDITEYPELGTVEIWRFVNRSGMTHPVHLHQKEFQVLDRQSFAIVDGEVVPQGTPAPPAPEEAGPKDTVQVHPGEIVRVIKRFEDYTGRFAYHCHILEHEDHEMMRQFQTVQCGNGVLEPTEECDDGDTLAGDGCAASCEVESAVSLQGVAQGGSVEITVDGVAVVVPTTAGWSAAQVAAAVADALAADPTLSAAGVTSSAFGSRVVTTGRIEGLVLDDPGLAVAVPALGPAAGLALLGLLAAGGGAALRARRAM